MVGKEMGHSEPGDLLQPETPKCVAHSALDYGTLSDSCDGHGDRLNAKYQ
jgi:hypothetical protein